MSLSALRQYLEMLKYSGIDKLYVNGSSSRDSLIALEKQYSNCTKCQLHANRIKFVYGEGNPSADVMIVGEGPGEQENLTGRPFVGDAGNLLNKMLAAIHFPREEVYIANIVKCRPPGNRNPMPEERLACMPYLVEQINIVQPRLLLAMGLVAAQTLLGNNNTLQWHRGQQHDFMGIPLYVTYHPAALLRNPHWKAPAWEDLQAFEKVYQQLP